jgi:hypothetical protein
MGRILAITLIVAGIIAGILSTVLVLTGIVGP